MAQKGYPGAVNNPPPPAVYTYPNSTVVVQQQQRVVVHRSSGGLFGKIRSGLDQIGHEISKGADWTADQINKSLSTTATGNVLWSGEGFDQSCYLCSPRGLFGQIGRELNMIGRELDYTADQINRALSTTATGQILALFQSGNVVELISRASGRCLQVVQGLACLVCDGLGADNIFNAQWTVVNEGANQVRLHNNNNFLAIVNGATVIMHMPPGSVHTNDTKFQMTQLGQFIVFSSMREPGKHIGILPNGQLKAALATGREDHAQFGVRLVLFGGMLPIDIAKGQEAQLFKASDHSPHGVKK